jgi:hypothetical protein
MAKMRGTGLLMLWTDVDPQHEADFNSKPWTRRIRPHMRLDEGSPAVLRRIHPEEAP